MFDVDSLSQSLSDIGALKGPDGCSEVFEQLTAAYDETGRHYHSAAHISQCLIHFQTWRHLAENPAEIEIAIWFHDAVYDTHKSDNEQRSADWAQDYLSEQQIDKAVVDRIAEMILATKDHRIDKGDAALMVDIDLGILSASPANFEIYNRQIRQEYHWVPSVAYQSGRRKVLSEFLNRDQIYKTPAVREQLEVRARKNLELALAMN